jgi:hypothetical protein
MSTHGPGRDSAGGTATTTVADAEYPHDVDVDDIDDRGAAIQHMPKALIDVGDLFGVGEKLQEKLVGAGFSTIPDIHHSAKWKLELIDGVGEDTARALKSLAASRCDHHFGDYAWEPFKEHEPEIARDLANQSR